jgi:formylglycine-generating enzyme required for sulfatase activity
MSDFFKKFLIEDARRFSPSGRYVGLAAFGKHPGWDDHVEDLGLETESLNIAKTLFYVNGIGGQIDAGAWERLPPGQQLPSFKHVFLWQRSGQFLIGRLWSSSDGKGRKRYPMVVCLHFIGVTLGWAIKQALPVLAELEAAFVQTNSADDVRALLNRKRAALREALVSAQVQGEYAPVSPEALNNIIQNGGGANREGFLRVLYQGQSQLAALAPGKFNARAQTTGLRAQQIRVPASGANPEQTLLFWTRFFLTQVDPSVPLLFTLPLEANWLDATAGEPESHEFFCLRASPKAVPLVSEVPYTLDDAFRSGATTFLERFQRGDTKAADLPTPATETVPLPPPAKSGWRKWLGAGLFLIFAGIAAYILVPRGGLSQRTAGPAETNHESSKATAQIASTTSVPPKVEVPKSETPKADAAKIDAPKEVARIDPAVEAARVAEEKKNSDAMAAAAKLKAETEAAVKEKEQQMAAEAARIAKEKQIAAQKQLEEQQRKAAEEAAAKKKAAEDAKAKMELAAAVVTPKAESPKPADASPASMPLREMTNSIGMVLVLLPSGTWVGKYEVTQGEYRKVMWSNPSKSINDRQPVERVTWSAANAFCQRLTEKEHAKLPAGSAYSLPTQKQWEEFAAGQKFEDLSNKAAARTGPAVVGDAGSANRFGLFDVLGNVWEWSLDGGAGSDKLLKGGAFDSTNYDLSMPPDRQMPNCGFRCVLVSH